LHAYPQVLLPLKLSLGVDPIISGFFTGVHVLGRFPKDYRSIEW